MKKPDVRALIEEIGIIPVIGVSLGLARFAAEAVNRAGIHIMEVNATAPGATDVITHLTQEISNMAVGAGTVLDTATAGLCVDAGAMFLTSPGLDVALVEFAIQNNVVVFPGALTPTEVHTAWKAGADFVKIFPCAQVGGESYIRALNASMPQIPLIASGGINQNNAFNFIAAGAIALGVGGELIPKEALLLRQEERIQELARRFLEAVNKARAQKPK